MRSYPGFLFLLIFFLTCSLEAQTSEREVTLQIEDLVRSHKENILELYRYRGAPETWIDTGNVNEDYLNKNVLSMYYKNLGILTYTYIDSILYINLFSKGVQKEHTVKIDKNELQDAVNDVNLLFSSNFLNRAPKLRGSKARDSKHKAATLKRSFKKLNGMLFPVELELEAFDHLIIVPTFNLSTLPYSAFKINDRDLIEVMSYSIAPNLFELALSNEQNKKKFNYDGRAISYFWENALFVSNPEYPTNLDWEFPDLPGAQAEVDQVIKIAKPNNHVSFSGKTAVKDSILPDICDFDLIYFATHGISNADSPMDHSFLVMADNQSDRSYLTLREIMNTRTRCELKADLVVLSACQTGLGRSHEGGIIGLARAFQIAGAKHVLMSLWNIDDKETATLMTMFFEELLEARELMPHEALRQAILKYKSEVNDDPKFWAAFSIFGVPY